MNMEQRTLTEQEVAAARVRAWQRVELARHAQRP